MAATANPAHSRSSARTAVVVDVLRQALAANAGGADILDIGGGTGGLAVPLAQAGHRVTVVDPSPDSLAALDRRAAETSTQHLVRGIQGDAAGLGRLVPPTSIDLALCHSVLEVVDDPGEALDAVVATLRPGGRISVLVANRVAAVAARVAAGRLAEAAAVLHDPAGQAGGHDPLSRRFTVDEISQLLQAARLEVQSVHGIRVFADSVPNALLEADAEALELLLQLEFSASTLPAYFSVATQLHLLCQIR